MIKILKKIKNRIFLYKIYLGIKNKEYSFTVPYRFSICPTYKCNTNCIACWCYSPEISEEKKLDKHLRKLEIPYSKLSQMIIRLIKKGTFYFSISGGGEPLLYSKIIDLINLIKKNKSIRCDINTNFINVNDKIINCLINNEVNAVIISLWAASPEVYEKTHPGANEKKYFEIIDNIKKLNSLRIEKKVFMEIILNYVILSKNFFEFEKMVELAFITKSTQLRFTHVDIVKGQTDSLKLNKEQAIELKKNADKIEYLLEINEKKYNHKVTLIDFDYFKRRLDNLVSVKENKAKYDSKVMCNFNCYAGWAFFQIFPDGVFNSCCRIVDKRGNINENSFNEVWNNSSQKNFRKMTHHLTNEIIQKNNLPCSGLCDNLHDTRYINNRLKTLFKLEKLVLKPIAYLINFIFKFRRF